MKWFYAVVRMIGTTQPFTSWLVQLQAELTAEQVEARLSRLEDPISTLHPDIPQLGQAIYEKLRLADDNHIHLDVVDYERFSRALAALEAHELIRGLHAVGKRFADGLRVSSPLFVMYLCRRFERPERMERLYATLEDCGAGARLRSQEVMLDTDLPNPVICAMFEAYEAKGYGIMSRENGINCTYIGVA